MFSPVHLVRASLVGRLLAAVFLLAGGVRLHAQADGSQKWGPFSTGGRITSSPAASADGKTIYLGVYYATSPEQGQLIAIDSSGGTKWKSIRLPMRVESSPTVAADGTIYIGCADGKLYAFAANSTGENVQPIRHYATDVAIGLSSAAIKADGTIYIGGTDSALHAFAPNGTEIWKHAVGDWVDSSPAVAPDGTIYFGSWDKKIYAVNPDNTEKWVVPTGAEVISSPAIGSDGTVYVGSSDKKLYAIAPDGTPKWTFLTEGAIQASPVLAPDGTIYVGSLDGKFYAIYPDGTRRWTGPAGRAIVSTAAVRGDGVVIYGSDDGVIRAINPADATIKWPFAPPDKDIIEASPLIAPDGTIYVATLDGRLFALNGNGSPLSTYSTWPMFRHDAVHSGLRSAPSTGGKLINLATRGPVGSGVNLIAGMVVNGAAPKNFLLRGIGPGLEQFQVGGFLSDPKLTLRTGNFLLREDDNWGSGGDGAQIAAVSASVGAFALTAGSKDSAFVTSLVPGPYTVVVGSVDGSSGVALVEAYDAAQSNTATGLINLSTRALAGNGEGVLTPGLVIGGGGTLRVLIRAIGPGLAGFGVPNVLAQPTINVFSGPTLVRTNTGWTSGGLKADLAAAMLAVGAFPLADGSADCAMLLTLNSGAYTFQIAGVGGTTGEVLVEVYVVP